MVITRTTRNRLSGKTLRGFESHHLRQRLFGRVLLPIFISFRGISAVGSAPHWQCGGQGFKSPILHQKSSKQAGLLDFSFFTQNTISMKFCDFRREQPQFSPKLFELQRLSNPPEAGSESPLSIACAEEIFEL